MIKPVIRLLHFLEDAAIILLISSIVLLSISQIVLRNMQLGGIPFADEAMRNAVLWLAFFGAMRASRLQNAIAINLLVHFHNEKIKKIIHFIVYLSCAAVCLIAAYYSWRFVQIEMEMPEIAFLSIPTWFLEGVIPFGLFVIAIRFITQSNRLPNQHDSHA
jgi:TRAP-type C4-dicarboxylate transport system permease small subunit